MSTNSNNKLSNDNDVPDIPLESDIKDNCNQDCCDKDDCYNDECCNDNCCNDGCCDSDSEEYHNFIEKMHNSYISFQNIYEQFCKDNNREINPMEMMSFMDILRGGSGKFVCLAGEDEISEEDKKYVSTLDEFDDESIECCNSEKEDSLCTSPNQELSNPEQKK